MRQLDKKSVWIFFFNNILSVVLFIPLILVVTFGGFGSLLGSFVLDSAGYLQQDRAVLVIAVFIAVFALVSYAWANLTYHFYKYEMSDLGFRKESGVIWKRYVTIPYSRIQNVDIHRGVLARLLRLSDLQIQTAGASATMSRYGVFGMDPEGRLIGISKNDAELLRDELIRRAGKVASQGL